jgi:hypothetical protein
MAKRALLVGIDHYQHFPRLTGCVADATAMQQLLHVNHDGSRNFDCRLLVSSDSGFVTRPVLRASWHQLFDDFDEDILFYFSGHGASNHAGGYLGTSEGNRDEPGLPTDELLTLANKSRARTVLLILDSCHAGEAGDPAMLQRPSALQTALIRDGVTILAAAGPAGSAREVSGHGVFTNLVLGALGGGAADVRGRVSAAAVYAYAEQALSSWDQRPLYKTYGDRLPPVRLCKPMVPDPVLRLLPGLFKTADSRLTLDPSFERTHESARPRNVATFNRLKVLRNAGLLGAQSGKDLFFVAMHSGWVHLTPLGKFYWQLAANGQLGLV